MPRRLNEPPRAAGPRGGKKNSNRQAGRANKLGRPADTKTGPSPLILRRGEYVAIFRDSGAGDAAIGKALAPRVRSDPTDTLDRWENAYRTFVTAAKTLDPTGSPELEAFQRAMLHAWQLSAPVRARVWACRGDIRRPARNRHHRDGARTAFRNLQKASARLRAAQQDAGVRFTPKVGENQGAQEAVAKYHSPKLAVSWIDAEIEELLCRHEAIRAERTAAVRRLAESWQPADAIDAEIARRIASLRELRARLTSSPVFVAEQAPSNLEKLDASLNDQLERVRHRPHAEHLTRATDLALNDSNRVARLSREIAGDRWRDLVQARLTILFNRNSNRRAA
jgi:hypothetical protein